MEIGVPEFGNYFAFWKQLDQLIPLPPSLRARQQRRDSRGAGTRVRRSRKSMSAGRLRPLAPSSLQVANTVMEMTVKPIIGVDLADRSDWTSYAVRGEDGTVWSLGLPQSSSPWEFLEWRDGWIGVNQMFDPVLIRFRHGIAHPVIFVLRTQ